MSSFYRKNLTFVSKHHTEICNYEYTNEYFMAGSWRHFDCCGISDSQLAYDDNHHWNTLRNSDIKNVNFSIMPFW